jgi:hypothetical protein
MTLDRLHIWQLRRTISPQGLRPKRAGVRPRGSDRTMPQRLKMPRSPLPERASARHSSPKAAGVGRSS